jgi:hypothetical protein
VRKRAEAAALLLMLGASSMAYAASAGGHDRGFYVGAGVLVFGTGKYANQDSGATSYSALVLPELSLSGRVPIGGKWGFAPLAAITPLGHKSSDGGLTTYVLRGEGKVTYLVGGTLDFQSGLGIADTIMIGAGGTTRLNNGDDTTVFGVPSKTSSSYLFYWQAGLGAELIKPIRIDLSAFVVGLLSSSRAFNFSLALSYGFL